MAIKPPVLSQRAWNSIHRMGFSRINDFYSYVNKIGYIPKIKGCGDYTLTELTNRVNFYNKQIGKKEITEVKSITRVRLVGSIPDEGAVNKVVKPDNLIFPQGTPPFKIIEISILDSFDSREKDILLSKSEFFCHNSETSYKQIGSSFSLTGERVRQLLKQSEKRLKTIVRKYLKLNPDFLRDSIYNEKKWSSYFVMNEAIARAINQNEETNFSPSFFTFIFSSFFTSHVAFSLKEESVVFIHSRNISDPDQKKVIKRIIAGKEVGSDIEYNSNTAAIISVILDEIN